MRETIDSRKTLIDCLTTESYWTSYAERVSGATTAGGSTLPQWVQSWNAKEYEKLYMATTAIEDGLVDHRK